MTIVVYPGTFDPITNGHLDIVQRAARLFDRIVASIPNVEVKSFSGLTVDFARKEKAPIMIRGLRMNADFEKEFEMAMMNRKLAPDLDLLCLMASQEYQFLSSSLLKEVACLNGNINDLVPAHVAEALRKKVHGTM